MNNHALLGLSFLTSLSASIVAARLFVLPALRTLDRYMALTWLVAPHMFLRTIGLSFLVKGVVLPSLPSGFAAPAAYGDFVAALLAILSTLALASRMWPSLILVWIFNLWGSGDLIFAIYQGNLGIKIDPGALGAAFYIPTFVVPPLLVTHVLIFGFLLWPNRTGNVSHSLR
jgi:hypothetical protein